MKQRRFIAKSIVFGYMMMSAGACVAEEAQHAKKEQTFMENVGIGSVAGTAEVLVNQPTVFVKNAIQMKKNVFALIKESPSILYKGLGVNAVCMIPTTAAQISVDNALKEQIPGKDVQTSVIRNALAGGVSASLCNPSELVVVNQQNWKTNAWTTVQRLYGQHGLSVVARGYAAKASRDALFCAGFLTAYPIVKDRFEKEQGLKDMQSVVAATAAVGSVTAVVSHPFDTISTTMQGDAGKEKVQGFFDAAKKVYTQGGFKGFFAGFIPRTVRIMIAIPLMNAVKDAFKTEE